MERQQQSKETKEKSNKSLKRSQRVREMSAPLRTPSDLGEEACRQIATALNAALADTFTLYFKTKNFHWHMSGPHFREYHKMLDEQAEQILAMTDEMAERVRKLGAGTLKSLTQITEMQRIEENEADFVTAQDMLAELREDNMNFAASLRECRDLCDEHGDVGSTSFLEVWIDECEKRTWFLFETTREMHS